MREILYRIWDEARKKYVQDYDCFFVNPDGDIYIIDLCEGINRFCKPDRYIIEQYTGLKDKHGKKIFEGDVVKWFGYEVKSGRQVRPERTMCINDYVKDAYRIFCITDNTGQTVEIIGNIHEVEVQE